MDQNRFWFDVRNYIDMVHDEYLMTPEFMTKEALWSEFWNGAWGRSPSPDYQLHPALRKAYDKGKRFTATATEGRCDDYLQDLSAVWGRWSKYTSLIHGAADTLLYNGCEITEQREQSDTGIDFAESRRDKNVVQITGHWVIAEAGAASTSHWPMAHYAPTAGYPSERNGRTMATKDYYADKAAQRKCYLMAQNYDHRAIGGREDAVVVSFDGVILRGNLRTMAGMLAAKFGTDAAYIDYLKNHCQEYGIKPSHLEAYDHPRLLFMRKREAKHVYSASEFSLIS